VILVTKIISIGDRLKPLNTSKGLTKNHPFLMMTSQTIFDIMGDVSLAREKK
jgi:hypothetical protein